MSKISNIVYNSIYNYPSLYYKWEFAQSRLAVLNHTFLVIGNGMDLKLQKGKYVFMGFKNTPKDIKQKIDNNEPFVVISKADQEFSSKFKMVWPDRNGTIQKRMFLSDYEKLDKNYPEFGHELKEDEDSPEFLIQKYPDKEHTFQVTPYPFSIQYCPFMDINPNTKKYTYKNIKNITVEEIAESKKMIPEDYSEAIVEVFLWALEFYENDEKFLADSYYNWKADAAFKKKYIEATSSDSKHKKFCEYYELEVKQYIDVDDFVNHCVANQRNRYITDCKKIIQAFS